MCSGGDADELVDVRLQGIGGFAIDFALKMKYFRLNDKVRAAHTEATMPPPAFSGRKALELWSVS